MEPTVTELRALLDRRAVQDVPLTYARGIDRRDWDLVRGCFTEDCTIDGSRGSGTVDEYLTMLRPGVERYPTTMHFMGNQLATVDGDEGHVETYAVAYHWAAAQAGAADDTNLIVGVRYHDDCVRTPVGWRIRRRWVSPDWRTGPYPDV
jgi:hypothetical protein